MPNIVIDHLNDMSKNDWKEGEMLTFVINDSIIDADTQPTFISTGLPEEEIHEGAQTVDDIAHGDDIRE